MRWLLAGAAFASSAAVVIAAIARRRRRAAAEARAKVFATGSAYGFHYSTEEIVAAHARQRSGKEFAEERDFVKRVSQATGFHAHSVALPAEDLYRKFTRAEYLQHRCTNLVKMAQDAAEMALADWGGDRSTITHLYWGTMTGGMQSPTIDIELVRRLGLSPDVERTSIEGMGCLTGFRLLNLARNVTFGNPKARVLVVCGDLRAALCNSMPDRQMSKEELVSVGLFRDGASSAVVGSTPLPTECSPKYDIVAGISRVLPPSSKRLVDYHEEDGSAISLCLSKDLPGVIAAAEPDLVRTVLKLGQDQCDNHKVPTVQDMDVLSHTGGPRVLSGLAKSLAVTEEHMTASWAVMRAHGNLSGASNLAVLDSHAKQTTAREWQLCLSCGPGVCLEGVLLRRLDSRPTPPPLTTSSEKAYEKKWPCFGNCNKMIAWNGSEPPICGDCKVASLAQEAAIAAVKSLASGTPEDEIREIALKAYQQTIMSNENEKKKGKISPVSVRS